MDSQISEPESKNNDLNDFVFEEDEYGYLELKSKKASQVLASQLPSRHLDGLLEDVPDQRKKSCSLRRRESTYRTLQLKNAASLHSHIDPHTIYEILTSDPNVSEEEKMQTLREMHQSLTVKRQVKEKLDADRKRKIAAQTLGSFIRFKLSVCMTFHQLWYEVTNFFSMFEPWQSSIKSVQGKFGSCVASYFIFLRWLLYLNLINLGITLCFVVGPHFLQKPFSYLGNRTEPFRAQDLLTGSGWFMDSILYSGAYSSEVIEVIPGLPYNMPLAYIYTIMANMLINLVAVSISIASSYQKNYVDTAGDIKNVFCNKIFSAWDYGIETETAATLQRQAFCNDIKELLYRKRLSERTMTFSQKVMQKTSFALVSLFSVAVIGAVGYLTYYLLHNKSLKVDIPILEHMSFALTVSLLSSIFFYLLKYSTRLEAFLSQKRRLYLTMIRVAVLRVVMLGIITYFWMLIYKPPRDAHTCYEADLGSEFYRLILVNFLVAAIVFSFFGEFVRKLIHTYVTLKISLKEFDVAYDTLDLIYFQTLAWLAMYCFPLAPLMVSVMFVFLFYIKMASVSMNCRPPKRSWSLHETHTFYLALTFVMFLFCAATIGFTIFILETSYCGPLKHYQRAGDVMWRVFKSPSTSETLRTITSPGILFAVFCALCLVVHYIRAQAYAHTQVIQKIRETLILASKDKVFLLKLFDEAVSAQSNEKPAQKSSSKKNGRVQKGNFSQRPHQSGFRHVLPPS